MKPMHFSKPARYVFAGTLFALLLGFLARPLPHRIVTGVCVDGTRYKQEFQRTYEVLPFSDWGLFSQQIIACGSKGGSTITKHRFIFVAVVDENSTVFGR